MRRIISLSLLALTPAAVMATAPAALAASTQQTPRITRVLPMRVSVGAKLAISGKDFKARPKANTVIFRSPNGRLAFAKPRRASRTRLVVVVPAAVARLLVGASGRQRPTRFKLRVIAGRVSKFTIRRLSPVITRRDTTGGGDGTSPAVCNDGGSGGDHDGDLLLNGFESSIKTDSCLRDTDLDGVEDGFEWRSARDLNGAAVPYPGSRPYANPLDSSDANADFDGDGLRLSDEYRLWERYSADGAVRSTRPGSLDDLLYSDGFQYSRNVDAPAAGSLLAWSLDLDDSTKLRDDERDADNDGLGNWDEATGKMTEAWWPAVHNGTIEPKESQYPAIDFLDNEDTAPRFDALVDPDMDGDGVLDGPDDADHDGVSNMFEVRRPGNWSTQAWVGPGRTATPSANSWAYTNPFNPCKPLASSRCHAHPPIGYYDSDERPETGPVTATTPQPTTPNG
jgi:hypothetical protein